MEDRYNKYAALFKALSDENRLRIMDYLAEGECCACKILEQLHISQPTLSHHMKVLYEVDFVKARKEGKWMHYSLNVDKIQELEEVFQKMIRSNGKSNTNNQC